ncbi:MAG: alpha/beta hydrolase [Corynebacterium sp.]|nr:alpha/beta hydrolase [Corynebacterium sp.]
MNDVVHDDSTGRDFHIGGNEAGLSPEEQFEQLSWYIHEHYPRPEADADIDRWVGMLPDRITHASMLMLGSAVDHAMPGVAYLGDVHMSPLENLPAVQFSPSAPSGRWAISLHGGAFRRGSGIALDNAWRPEVAAAAELSGTTIIDVDYPLLPASVDDMLTPIHEAISYARSAGATHITAWGASAGAALAVLSHPLVDALLLTRPQFDTSALGLALPAPELWPSTCIQVGLRDTTVKRWQAAEDVSIVKEYLAEHLISTPEVARQRIRDAADFLKGL